MNGVIKINATNEIDLAKLVDSRLLVQANSGGGKSWLLRRLLEQSHGKVQQIVIDPEGEFSSLREKYDYVLAGKDGDTPAEPRSAALLARRLLELNVSAIIDLYELHPQERKRFVRLFLEAMVNSPKELHHPCLVVIDEAHTFAPEKGQSEAMDAVIGLASLGRKRGFCAVLATQRISKLHKDAAAECNNKLIGRTGLDIDRKRAAEELGFTTKEQVLSLRTLEPGEFYAFGPAISTEVINLRVGEVKTTHPKAGARFKSRAVPPTAKIKALLPKLSDLPAEAQKEAVTVSSLQAQVRNLTQENTVLKRQAKVTDSKEIENAVKAAVHAEQQKFFNERGEWQKQIENWFKILKDIAQASGRALEDYKKPVATKPTAPPEAKYSVGVDFGQGKDKTVVSVARHHEGGLMEIVQSNTVNGSEQRILNAIGWLESIGNSEPEQTAVAFLAGYTYGGGGFNNPRGSLRTKGLVEYKGNRIALTDIGRTIAQIPQQPLTTEELHAKVLSVLPGPEQKLLRPLLEVYPQDMSNEELAAASGYQNGSGGFNNPKGRLRTLGLVEYPSPGRIKAKSLLFI